MRGLVKIAPQSGSEAKKKLSIDVRSVDMIPALPVPKTADTEVLTAEKIHELGQKMYEPGYVVPICEASEETFKTLRDFSLRLKGITWFLI